MKLMRFGKQALSLVLALELFCAPAAMAYASGDFLDEQVETPAGAELNDERPLSGDRASPAASPAAELAAAPEFYYADLMFGESTGTLDKEGFRNLYDAFLTREGGEDWMWDGGIEERSIYEDDTGSYLCLPNVGRMPDWEFDGFYVYHVSNLHYDDGWKDTNDLDYLPNQWTFERLKSEVGEEGLAALKLTDVVAPEDVPEGLKTDRDCGYDPNGTVVRLPEDPPYGDKVDTWYSSLPLIGRWVKSGESGVTGLGLKTGDTPLEAVYTEDIVGQDLAASDKKVELTYESGSSVAALSDDQWKEVTDGEGNVTRELWVRVPEPQTAVTVTLETYEPHWNAIYESAGALQSRQETQNGFTLTYYRAEKTLAADGAGSPVRVSAVCGGEALTVSDLTGSITSESVSLVGSPTNATPGNSADYPARSRWTATVSGLKSADGSTYYNDVTAVVTSPDGAHTTTYVLHIERQAKQEAALEAGNTPYGLIRKGTNAVWTNYSGEVAAWAAREGITDYSENAPESRKIAVNKAFAQDYFKEHNRRFHDTFYPRPSAVNGTQLGTFRNYSYFNCWVGEDLDLSETAVVAYQDSSFVDPGVSFVDSEGNAVSFGDGAGDYAQSVTRTIRLLEADALTPDLLGADERTAGVEAVWYAGAGGDGTDARLATGETAQVLRDPQGRDVVDLRGLNLLPGIYEMVYQYTDPMTGETISVTRPLVLLPIPGDVDMDGAVTAADAVALAEHYAAWEQNDLSASPNATLRLLKYRVFDVDHNGTLAGVELDPATRFVSGYTGDVQSIYSGFQPRWLWTENQRSTSDYYYPMLEQGTDGTYARKTWSQVDASAVATPSGTLTLEYLGVEAGLRQPSGATLEPTGPWNISDEGKEQGVELLVDGNEELGARDTFWMGVKLDPGADLQGQTVQELTVTLIYDSRYVEPTAVYDAADKTAMENAGVYDTPEGRWAYCLRKNNLDANITDTLWSGTYALSPATAMTRSYDATHYSKVISDLEDELKNDPGGDSTGFLREVVFSVRLKDGSDTAVLGGEKYVAALPFRLKAHPPAVEHGSALLVELGAGMRDFNLVTRSNRSVFATLLSLFTGRAGETTVTSAFSAQDAIYGDATQNLREAVAYDRTQVGEVKLGRNNTEETVLLNGVAGDERGKNARYDVYFETNAVAAQGGDDIRGLPPGLDYNSSAGILSGYPTRAGEYHFTIRGVQYRLTVEQRELRYYAENKSSYYGQPELRGAPDQQPADGAVIDGTGRPNQQFTFRYYMDDIADVDKEGKTLTGDGAELAGVIGTDDYSAPQFWAVDAGGQPVRANSPAGADKVYTIQEYAAASHQNYKFVYCYQAPNGDARGRLNIVQRPVQVDYIKAAAAVNPSAHIYHDEGNTAKQGLVAGGSHGGEVVLTIPSGAQDEYNGLPLWGGATLKGDQITATFTGRFDVFLEGKDHKDTNTFVLDGDSEERPLSVSMIQLSGDGGVNYNLRQSTPVSPDKCEVYGVVSRRAVTDIWFHSLPGILEGTVATHGDSIVDRNSLRIAIVKAGAVTGAFQYTQYDSDELRDLGVRINWVTPEEREEGMKPENAENLVGTGRYLEAGDGHEVGDDMRRYGGGTDVGCYQGGYISRDMDGYYLCVSVRKYGEGGDANKFFKVYTDTHLTVNKKPMVLTPRSLTRFYGEDNGGMTYTYDVSALTDLERTAGKTYTGTAQELEELLGDSFTTRPTLKAVERVMADSADEVEVTATTDYSTTDYAIKMFGAEAENYTFYYQSADGDLREDYGTAALTVLQRPIVVQNVAVPDGNFATIYADTHKLTVDLATLQTHGKGELRADATFQKDGETVREIEFALPRYDAETGRVSYWAEGIQGSMAVSEAFMASDPVLKEDESKLGLTYEVTFMPDRHIWSSFTDNYYDLDENWVDGRRTVPVEVNHLTLVGEKAKNYRLVYCSDLDDQGRDLLSEHDSLSKVPASAQSQYGPYENVTSGYLFRVSGTGTVILRPIKSLKLTHLGRMRYTYGEPFAPNEFYENDNDPMTIQVTYDTLYENDPVHNAHEGYVKYTLESELVDGQMVHHDSFTLRGFTLYYATDEQVRRSAEDGMLYLKSIEESDLAIYRQQRLDWAQYLTPGEHNGKHLFVVGRRGEKDTLIFSQVTNATLRVAKRDLTLTAQDVHRFYGEAHGLGEVDEAFTFTASAAELAIPDREALGLTEDATVTRAQLATLAGYVEPRIFTDSTTTATSPVSEKGWGDYPLYLQAAGGGDRTTWDNYNVTLEDGHVYVYPRPITGNGVYSGEANEVEPTETDANGKGTNYANALPVYTIYSEVTGSNYPTQLSTKPTRPGAGSTEEARAAVQLALDMSGTTVKCADGVTRSLPLTYGAQALVGDDTLSLSVDVKYSDTDLGDTTDRTVKAETTFRKLVDSATARNYSFRSNNIPWPSFGAIKLRSIGEIHIVGIPNQMEYVYGEALDLTGLRVSVTYRAQSGTTEQQTTVTVPYQGVDDFKAHGLYVNYWDVSDRLPTADAARKELVTKYRTAKTGDHITIAPEHGTGYDGFVANGKALVLSAFQAGKSQDALPPKLVGALQNGYYEGTTLKLKVTPRRLTYTLTAEDKVYDGTTAAAGTLTLTNIYQSDGVTDGVYVPIGADYEKANWATGDFLAYGSLVQNGQKSFQTGTFTESGAAPLGANGTIHWTAGYDKDAAGLLKFNFTNPNVHYVDATFQNGRLPGLGTADLADYWAASQQYDAVTNGWDHYNVVSAMPVVVTGMTIQGPDAANYTWGEEWADRVHETSVTVDTRSGAESGQAAAPYATIRKANRDTIQALRAEALFPMLQVDEHTNVVYLTFTQRLAALGDNNNALNTSDEFRDELHYEYALFYQDPETGLYAQWAGPDGGAAYQDTQFFGGETVTPDVSGIAGYQPNVEQLPKEETAGENTVYKGQRYRWAALDTGVSELGYRESAGFYRDDASYPGGAAFAPYYWWYDLYATDRAALPRGVTFYPLVRLAATHNYNASGCVTGVDGVSAQTIYDVQSAVRAYRQDPTDDRLAAAQQASDNLFGSQGCQEMTRDAEAERAEEQELAAQWAETGQWPETAPEGLGRAAKAIRTYVQRLDLLSTEEARSADQKDETNYLIQTLEAVWFTDTLTYEEMKLLDAAVYNHPTRYYAYYFDVDQSAQVNITTEEMLDLRDVITGIEIHQSQADGSTLETTMTANEGHNLTLYVRITNDDGRLTRSIRIYPTDLVLRLGDAPFLLQVITNPEKPSNRRYRWTSSDPSVVTVDERGLVTVRGVGTAVITVRTTNGKVSTCAVTVLPASPVTHGALFDRDFHGAYMTVDDAGAFYPKKTMTRGELVVVLDLFLREDAILPDDRELAYVDVNHKERYTDALRRLTAAGVVEGVPGNAFEGDREATRAELATAIARFLQLNVIDTRGWTHAFRDAGEDQTWAYAYIDALARVGLVTGTGDGRFSPNDPVKREEVAAILARLLTIPTPQGSDVTVPSDVTPANWSYEAILRAVNSAEFPAPEEKN